jgi:probable phosphoglycerate mutase
MRLLFLRHGSTSWNEAGRIQGQTDVPLSEIGRTHVAGWRLSAEWATARCFTSPLARARETASLLGFRDAAADARLREMAWGACEGGTLDGVRRRYGAAFAETESRGLDFRPPGGETPREVAARLAAFLREIAQGPGDVVVVAHRGVLRASLVLAFDWDMLGKPPVAVAPDRGLQYRLDTGGGLSFVGAVDLHGGEG